MRSVSRMCVAVVVGLALVPASLAGVYSTVEGGGKRSLSLDYRVFQNALIPLRQMSGELEKIAQKKTAAETPLHKRFKLVANLFVQNPAVKLTDEERLNVGTYLLRLSKFSEANKALDPRQFQDKNHFLAYATLATNDYLWGTFGGIPGKVQNATTNLGVALQLWPKDWNKLSEDKRKWFRDIGWQQDDYEWYRKCDEYLYKLFLLRRKSPKTSLGDDVEPLFVKDGKPVRFVGADGKYQVGGMAVAEKAKLPPDALEIVEQLLLWMPNDDRLSWLLAELFNAQGDEASALDIFLQIGIKNKFYHDVIRLYGPNKVPPEKVHENQGKYPEVMLKHIEALQKKQAPQADQAPPPGKQPPPPTATMKPRITPTEEPMDLRSLAVGFGFGLLVAFFGYWQYHEIRRRRS